MVINTLIDSFYQHKVDVKYISEIYLVKMNYNALEGIEGIEGICNDLAYCSNNNSFGWRNLVQAYL